MRNSKNLPKIIVVVGPTSSGKSNLAVKLAKKFNGEVVSADSRQVYRGMDIGTGKVPISYEPQCGESTKSSTPPQFSHTKSLQTSNEQQAYINSRKTRAANSRAPISAKRLAKNLQLENWGAGAAYYRGIQHYLLNVASPTRTFTVTKYVKLAKRAIKEILRRNKLPIICGGTGFYIQALIDDIAIPQVPPNIKLRQELEKKPLTELAHLLRQKDPERAATIDLKNKRRLIRALEIIDGLGKVPKINQASNQKFNPLFIGIQLPPEKLRAKIKKRLLTRLKQGMLTEVEALHHQKNVSWKKLESFGLEYRYVAQYLKKRERDSADASLPIKVLYEDMTRQLELAIWHYAKRQMTWFKKDKRIKWVDSHTEALRATKKFLKN